VPDAAPSGGFPRSRNDLAAAQSVGPTGTPQERPRIAASMTEWAGSREWYPTLEARVEEQGSRRGDAGAACSMSGAAIRVCSASSVAGLHSALAVGERGRPRGVDR